MWTRADYGPDIRLCLDVSPSKIQHSTVGVLSHGSHPAYSTSNLLNGTHRLGLNCLTRCSKYYTNVLALASMSNTWASDVTLQI